MPRRDDDEFDDDDRPRRRPRDDDDDDRPSRSRRSRDDDDFDSPPKKKSNIALILVIVLVVLFVLCGGAIFGGCYFLKRGVSSVQNAADRMNSSNNLKEIGLACHLYADKYDDIPNNSYDANGKPLLSWRVHILPFLGEQGLYNQFNLNEPWDSATNKRLLSQMPRVYATPSEQMGRTPKGTTTYYRGFSNPGTLFAKRGNGAPPVGKAGNNPPGGGPRLTFMNITDGMSNTILAVEAGDPVEWTKPDDLDASPGKPFPKLGGIRPAEDTVLVLFADGTVTPIKRSNSEILWRGATTYAGNEIGMLDR
ncbi:MAG TPA: DUF1559 domain-containing protein [Gemmataceae bacterium]|jgi:hypothetical protein|nr:DUF1559 domain-containing protein [Gemmataceae bacterium]